MKEVRMAEGPTPETVEESTEAVNVYQTQAHCAACGDKFTPDGTSVAEKIPLGLTGRTLWRHRCEGCGRGAYLVHKYPRVHYTPAEIPIEEQLKLLNKERYPNE